MKPALCNELFSDYAPLEFCRIARRAGFLGVELDPESIEDEEEWRQAIRASDLSLLGFHLLFPRDSELNLLSERPEVRRDSWDHLTRLADRCSGMGGSILVLGSGSQRRRGSQEPESVASRFVDEVREFLERTEGTGTTICLEPLPPSRTDFLNSLDEVAALLGRVKHPRLKSMFDFHNATSPAEEWPLLLEHHLDSIAHVHFNDRRGGFPGEITPPHIRTLRTLRDCGYDGWISVEIFARDGTGIEAMGQALVSAITEVQDR